MDIFKFHNPTHPLQMEQGEVIDGFLSKMWIERYRDAGEFTLVASVDSGIREKLPLGTFISHVDTAEIMIVENHEISDARGENTTVTITGRGFESYLEQRVVSSNRFFPTSGGAADYILPPGLPAGQAVYLIENHIIAAYLIDDNDAIPYVQMSSSIMTGDAVERSVKRGQDLYSALVEVLAIDKLGIKVVRPGIWSPLGSSSLNTALVIHRGTDRSTQVVYSYDAGEIESADYLWSIKKSKNSALVSGTWVEVRVDDATKAEYNRRMMYVDASDIDQIYDAPPVGTELTDVQQRMHQRGLSALASQKELVLAKAEVSKQNTKAVYRHDFDVGDTIMVSGDYNQTRPMRVNEFVEIEDEHGQSAYPTLTVDE